MKWVMVRDAGRERAGLVVDGGIHLLEAELRVLDLLGDDGERLARAGERALSNPAAVVSYEDASLAPPVRPLQIRDTLLFLQHLRNARPGVEIEDEWRQIPAFYFGNTASVVGPRDPVEIFPGSEWFDFELEVAAIIGREGSNVHPDDGDAHIAGFTIFNDWSARDLQRLEGVLGIGQAKGKDGANTLGPMFVTKDELEPYRSGNSFSLGARAFVNDELVGEGKLDQMDWSFGEVVSFASRGTRVLPGDAIGSGTVPTCCLAEHFALSLGQSLVAGEAEDLAGDAGAGFRGWLQPDDVVRLDVEMLGSTVQEVRPSVPVHRLKSGF